jgi:PEP-CTERM motif
VTCSNTSRGGSAPSSEKGSLFFLTGAQTYMNVAAGFETGFSFNYVSTSFSGAVNVYDSLNGTGYNAGFCPFGPAGVAFNGVAKSVSFGSVTPNVPEPETYALMALGLGVVGLASRCRRHQAV